jgi:hypothetical protein
MGVLFLFQGMDKMSMNIGKIEWKWISGIPGIPENRYKISNTGEVMYMKNGRILSKQISNRGYFLVKIGNVTCTVHKLVALFFVPGRTDEKCQVEHKDTQKFNNYADNLEWVTPAENMKRAYEKGLMNVKKGEDNAATSMLNSDVDKICQWLLEYKGNTKYVLMLCNENGIKASYQMIQQIKHKQTWCSVSDKWFDKNKFPVRHVTADDVVKICESLVKHKGSSKCVYEELKEEIPYVTYGIIQCIKAKQAHRTISDNYFTYF